jgi:hypothetical protein
VAVLRLQHLFRLWHVCKNNFMKLIQTYFKRSKFWVGIDYRKTFHIFVFDTVIVLLDSKYIVRLDIQKTLHIR